MPFPKKSTYNIKLHRKETDSHWAKHFFIIFRIRRERVSTLTSKGSLSLEAAVALPIFFFAMLCLIFLFEMMSTQVYIKNALYSTGKELAQQAYVLPAISTPGIREHMIEQIGKERLDNSLIAGGSEGIDCSNSSCNWNSAIMDLSVRYTIKIPVLMFQIPAIPCEESLKVKGWVGETPRTGKNGMDIVYITDYGEVYHEDISCTYLDVVVRGIIATTIQDARNDSGGKYYACEQCGEESHVGILYVTNYGASYHTTLSCTKIKRNIYAVSREDILGKGGCSKCVK